MLVEIFETNKEFKKALEETSGQTIPPERFKKLIVGCHPPYDYLDFNECLMALGGKAKKSAKKTVQQILSKIAEELSLWQEIKLHRLEPQLRKLRQLIFNSPKLLDTNKAKALLDDFFKSEDQHIRAAYVHLFMERSITAGDLTRYFSELKPNMYECWLATIALIMNRAYLSGIEALWYFLTGQRMVTVGIFNPTITLLSYRLVMYLQPGGRPARSMLSPREMSLLHLVGTAKGKPAPTKLWLVWNKQYPKWAFDSWRLFWKAFQRAKRRLLTTYDMAFEAERMQSEDPQHFWEKWLALADAK